MSGEREKGRSFNGKDDKTRLPTPRWWECEMLWEVGKNAQQSETMSLMSGRGRRGGGEKVGS